MSTIAQALDELHQRYVEAINIAVAEDDMHTVERLAAEFEHASLEVVRHQLADA